MLKQLKDLVGIRPGIHMSTVPNGKVHLLMPSLFDSFGSLDKRQKPQLEMSGRIEKHLLQKGDVLLAVKGTSYSAVEYQPEWGEAVASSSFVVLRRTEIRAQIVDPKYLVWFLRKQQTQKMLKSMAMGSGVPMVSTANLATLEVDLPSMEVQRLIAEAHELHTKERAIRRELDRLQEQLFEQQLTKISKR